MKCSKGAALATTRGRMYALTILAETKATVAGARMRTSSMTGRIAKLMTRIGSRFVRSAAATAFHFEKVLRKAASESCGVFVMVPVGMSWKDALPHRACERFGSADFVLKMMSFSP